MQLVVIVRAVVRRLVLLELVLLECCSGAYTSTNTDPHADAHTDVASAVSTFGRC